MKREKSNQEQQEAQAHSLMEPIAPGEIIIGTLVGMDEQGQALVNYKESPADEPLIAISTVALNKQQSGRQVALLFANGDPSQPVIMGLIHSPLDVMIENYEVVTEESEAPEGCHAVSELKGTQVDDIYLDGKRFVFEGKEEIVFKCGDASITLTKAGKILIRGKYLLNRSTGVNRIMGGSVQVN